MTKVKLLIVITLTTMFFVVFLSCNRRDYLSSGVLRDGIVDIQWLKNEFSRSNAGRLLIVNHGNKLSYTTTPLWDKATTRKNTSGKSYYYIPLKDDAYAIVNGKRQKLKMQYQRTYLVAFNTDNENENLTFVRGEYIMKKKPSNNPKNRNATNVDTEEVFAGLAAYTDQQNQVATYRYALSPKSKSNLLMQTASLKVGAPLSLSVTTTIEGPLRDSMLLADEMMAYWNIPLTIQELMSSQSGFGLVGFPEEFRQNIPPGELVRFSNLLSLFRIALIVGPDETTQPVEGVLICSRICRWGFGGNLPTNTTELGEVGVATRIEEGDICTKPPNGPEQWTLLYSEPGPCRWSNPGGQPPVTGSGGPPTPGDLPGSGSGGGGAPGNNGDTNGSPSVFIIEVSPGPFSTPLASNEWGRTELEGLDVVMSAYTDGSVWSGKLTALIGKYSMIIRLLPNVKEASENSSTSQNFCKQVTNLQLGTRQIIEYPEWFMLNAVQAHENVHRSRLVPILNELLPNVIAKVGLLQIANTGQTKEVAIGQLKALSGWALLNLQAMQDFRSKYVESGTQDHAFGAACDQAEFTILDPTWKAICSKGQQAGWPVCSYCN
ncbi:hypothetical protein [Niabella beijingensis]|uniref:hypothetical protein n=1 Tax=Niabella beijingensis TaxID=2872700 RepID=UPI001CBE94E6|nr:hypothetical protein [Niabella beijingensis]MBZ4192164.1 hypothetical protein [Niabella beijingensis]